MTKKQKTKHVTLKEDLPPETRRRWNRMMQKLYIGKTVTLVPKDTAWLTLLGQAAVKWYEMQPGGASGAR